MLLEKFYFCSNCLLIPIHSALQDDHIFPSGCYILLTTHITKCVMTTFVYIVDDIHLRLHRLLEDLQLVWFDSTTTLVQQSNELGPSESRVGLWQNNLNFFYLDFKRNNKLLLQPVGKYDLVAALLTNCHTCLYGSQTSIFFS